MYAPWCSTFAGLPKTSIPPRSTTSKRLPLATRAGLPAEKIASVGHSIGGYLAVALALRLRDRGEALPGAILSISPWADVTLSGAAIEAKADQDKLLSRG